MLFYKGIGTHLILLEQPLSPLYFCTHRAKIIILKRDSLYVSVFSYCFKFHCCILHPVLKHFRAVAEKVLVAGVQYKRRQFHVLSETLYESYPGS